MKKSLLISEQDSIAALLENDRCVEFFVNRGELLLGDIYSATVENILPGIDAAFVNLGKDKMGFLHANDVPGQGPLKERLVPKQKLLVQITKEPTGHKGPRVSTAIGLPGRFLVLVPEERGVSISRRISEARERARLKSVVNLMKPPGVGLIIRTEAKGQGENELFEDFEQLWDRWQTVVSDGEASIGPTLIYRDQDLLYRVIRDAYSHDITEIICDSVDGQRRAQEYLQGWAGKQTKVGYHLGDESILVSKGVDKEIEAALSDRVEMPSGGHLNIQPTEALTVIDVNSGRFTSSRTQAETVRRTNLEAAQEIARQLRLRNIGGMVIVDFIDMDSRKDQQQVLEVFQRVLEEDRAKPQLGQLSDLGLVELTRRRQGQSLRELFTVHCNTCSGLGVVPTLELGPADNRRVITFKSKDEESLVRGRPGFRRAASAPRQGSILRAASASNGRILPTVEEEAPETEFYDETAYVPEDILDQMPDDLLNGERASGKINTKRGGFVESDEDEIEEAEADELTFEVNMQSFAPTAAIVEEGLTEDEESSMHEDLTESISAVERVYQDMGARSQAIPPEVEEDTEAEDVVVLGSQAPLAEATALHEQLDDEGEDEEDSEPFVAQSPFETEIDPVTGVYRLKVKPAAEEQHLAGHENEQGGYRDYNNSAQTAVVDHHEEHAQTSQPKEFSWQQEIQYNASTHEAPTEVEQQHIPFEENVETLSDEFGGTPEEEQAHVQDTQAEEFDNEHHNVHNSTANYEEEQAPPQPQETHNS